jgi:hypothetical protein
MVGVVGSSPIAPTKFGRKIKGLAVPPSPLSLAVRKKYQRSANRARQALRLAAQSLWRSESALGAFYRRPTARMDKPKPKANSAAATSWHAW